MFPLTHLLSSWVIGAASTRIPRDCRLVALAGIAPDLDGAGIIVDGLNALAGHRSLYYAHYHHYLLHGWLAGVILAAVAACLASDKLRVALLVLAVFHLHLLFDFVGSRGPSPEDLWPIFYHGPFDKDPMWIWKGQWRLDSWINRVFTLALFAAAWWLAVVKGHSFVGVFSRRLDRIVVPVLQKWSAQLSRVRGNKG